jgi:predicted pyridoxine 5'-phosphate oxidase superfamily flavin-nucleotide-binding protein
MNMNPEDKYASDIAFTPSVKAIQEQKGSREAYARMEQKGSWATAITPDLAAFIAHQTTAFIATANAIGQPYIQHRGGPAGFLRIIDERTIGFADYPARHTSCRAQCRAAQAHEQTACVLE